MRMSQAFWLQWPARAYIGLMRGLPVLVLLMMIFYVVLARTSTDGLVVAIIAFALNFAAYAAEIFRAGIASIDPGQREGALAIGFNRLQAFLHITLPQTVQRILPVYKGEFISLVKMTSIVGYIAVEDLAKAGDIIRSRTFDAFFPLLVVAALYLLIGWMLLTVLQALERRLDPFERRRRREALGQSHALHLDAVGRT
jgi:polar amino acid transport system substrate-binding protein